MVLKISEIPRDVFESKRDSGLHHLSALGAGSLLTIKQGDLQKRTKTNRKGELVEYWVLLVNNDEYLVSNRLAKVIAIALNYAKSVGESAIQGRLKYDAKKHVMLA